MEIPLDIPEHARIKNLQRSSNYHLSSAADSHTVANAKTNILNWILANHDILARDIANTDHELASIKLPDEVYELKTLSYPEQKALQEELSQELQMHIRVLSEHNRILLIGPLSKDSSGHLSNSEHPSESAATDTWCCTIS